MSNRFLRAAATAVICAAASAAHAQNIDLTGGNADLIWNGIEANANAGLWMDQGGVSAGDGRRDLIIGAPGGPGLLGRVYVINGGPSRSGQLSLASADTIITGATAGDLFGAQTAAGNILNLEGSTPRNLVVAAPNAMSGRGVVYLFAAGFTSSASLTTANSVYRIVGLPNEHLGTSLATADLNNDGRREIIVGGPGSDRIYVFNGSASLSGTRNIETQGADQIIGGGGSSGLGNVMAAGDVTGDNINDLLVGSPNNGSVYLFRGNSAGTLTLDAHFDATPADRVGESIRIGDVDSDGKNDVIIGAPGVDGPGGRTDSGAIYVLYGSPGLGTQLLSDAGVTFFGEAAGQRLGTFVTSGDVNRDSPNDLVMLSPVASGGAGLLTVYYGRNRNAFGVDAGNGRRVVDLALGGADRKIFGDPATGVIRSAQVFEVTGEGARDIIVGVPAGQSAAGLVYFTVSPRLRLSTNALMFRTEEGGSIAGGVTVTNQSSIAIPWVTSSNRSWLTATPSGSTVNTAPGAVGVSASSVGMPVGVYTGTVNVTSTSNHLEMSLPVSATFMIRRRVARAADFNGDRAADFTVYRPSTGTWYTRFGNGSYSISQFGAGDDIPVAADYDGDRVIDRAVFRPSTGVWYLWYSSTNTGDGIQWGGGTDKPLPGDYDGDGRADLAVWRPSNGTWYVRLAAGPSYAFGYGANGDIPVPADYDGDGRTDFATFRPSSGLWSIVYARGGSLALGWGLGTDMPVPGDYDGNGAVDIAVYRPSNGLWYVRYSDSGAAAAYGWGAPGDRPIPSDYDGDGRTDLAVFRPSTGMWYLWYSSTGAQAAAAQWGASGDVVIR